MDCESATKGWGGRGAKNPPAPGGYTSLLKRQHAKREQSSNIKAKTVLNVDAFERRLAKRLSQSRGGVR